MRGAILAIGLAILLTPSAGLAEPAPLPEAPDSTIGYPTVSVALAALHAKPGVRFSVQDGWTVAFDEPEMTLWSFPPPGQPAYPSAVKRQIVRENGVLVLHMNVSCGASKAVCDDLVRSFQQLNAQMIASLRGG
jgi:hypothetical protein